MKRIKELVDRGFEVRIFRSKNVYKASLMKNDRGVYVQSEDLEELVEELRMSAYVHKHNENEIKLSGHKGTWYAVGAKEYKFGVVLQLEHSQYGEDANGLFVTENYEVLYTDEGNNGIEEFEAFLDATECEECGKTLRELLENGTAYEFINGEDPMCIDCQAELTSN